MMTLATISPFNFVLTATFALHITVDDSLMTALPFDVRRGSHVEHRKHEAESLELGRVNELKTLSANIQVERDNASIGGLAGRNSGRG